MLELKNICKTFNPGTINAKVALNHLNLTLKDGDFCTVIGGNGAGKSTMLNAVAGVFTVSRFSPTVLPVTVGSEVSSRPALVSSFITAQTPPARSRSSI